MSTKRSPLNCYDPRFLLLSIAAAAGMIGAAWIGKRIEPGAPLRVAIGLVQGGAAAAVILGMVRGIRKLDEMQQRIQLEALTISWAGTGILATGYGFLEQSGLPPIDWGTLVFPVMAGLWAIGYIVAARRYR